jgi:fructose transport system substrate-binding protein
MLHSNRHVQFAGRRSKLAVVGLAAALALGTAACGNSSTAGKSTTSTTGPSTAGASGSAANAGASTTVATSGASSGSGGNVKVALILKEFTNPYFISMEKSAKQEAAKLGVSLSVFAGTSDSDTNSQISEIDNAISAGDKGIIITPNGSAVNSALAQAKSAGIELIALDTVPIPANVVDITYATNNYEAGQLIGRWTAAKLAGKSADIALLDDVTSEVLSVDVERDHGFLNGMGINVGNPNINGQEPKSGHYSGGKGGTYKISCQQPTSGSQTGGQSAMETCLSKDPNINVVYTINEPSAEGAANALKAAGKSGVTLVTIDGGCSNLPYVASGEIGATAGQFPGKMAQLGVQAVDNLALHGTKPSVTPGLDFYDTGTQLYTDSPQAGVPSITTSAASKVCWGS